MLKYFTYSHGYYLGIDFSSNGAWDMYNKEVIRSYIVGEK